MSQFFEVLNTLQDPTVRFANDQGEPILALDKVGLEELSHSGLHHEPVFNGDDKLLWNMISSIDYEELRLGKHHMPQIQFVDIDLILERLSDEKAALVKKNCRCSGESWTKYHLPHNEIFHVEIDGLEIIKFLEGSTGDRKSVV